MTAEAGGGTSGGGGNRAGAGPGGQPIRVLAVVPARMPDTGSACPYPVG